MAAIRRQYVVDEKNRRVAVQLDLETFAAIEGFIEDYGLAQYIAEAEDDEVLDREAAESYYAELDKAP
jgi:hypothetical protein